MVLQAHSRMGQPLEKGSCVLGKNWHARPFLVLSEHFGHFDILINLTQVLLKVFYLARVPLFTCNPLMDVYVFVDMIKIVHWSWS